MAETQSPVVPVTNLSITQKHTTIVVEPSAAADGFDSDCYDSADLTTMLWVQNDQERWVEVPIPFPTEKFSASVAVISAGPDEYSDRLVRVKEIKGDLERFVPYLQRYGAPNEVLSDKKKLKEYLKGFRVALLYLPAKPVVIRIQVTMVIDPTSEDTARKTYRFRAYAPLPSFIVGGGRVPMTLMVIFKGYEGLKRTITKHEVSNPFGDTANVVGEPVLNHPICDDTLFCWKWQTDPVVDFEYRYEG